MIKIEDLVDLNENVLNKKLDEITNELNTSFSKYGNQTLLQEENDIWKDLSTTYDLTLEDNKNDNLIKEILLKQELLFIQLREVEIINNSCI